MLTAPYTLTSDDLLFAVHAMRGAMPAAEQAEQRAAFDTRAKACLRASALVKTHGWGLHHDDQGRVTVIAIEDAAYARLSADPGLQVIAGMRSRRK